ncbi:MAG: aminotransferase class III-fold pyridoxal phosphate-dependent enzyme, partial [Clostridia bacterium]
MDYLKTNKKFLVNDIAINQYVIEKSHSGYVVLNKKKYLDLTCGNGSTIFGFNNKFISKQITDQLNNALTLPSNYISTLKCELAVKFCSYSHLKKCFVTNTTQNALDYCLMFAQQFYYKQGLKRDKIIAVNCHDFNENYINITQNEADLHDACNKPNVCAVLLNLVDFEDKYDVISPTFITKAREFTKLNNLILIINETYSAIKTGAFFSFQKFGIKPDMVIVGDSVTNGLPFGAVLMKEAIAEFAEPMLTIENENLLSYAVAVAVFDKYTDSKTIAKQTDLQELIKKLLVKINNNCIETISNIGFCVSIGFVKDFSTEKLKIALYNKKILAFFENDILTINFPVSVSEGKIKFVLKTLRKVLLKLNPAVKTSKKVKAKTETLLTIEEENTAKQAKIKNKNKNKNKQAEQQIPLASSLKKLDDFVHTLESDTSLNVENASLNAKNRAVNIEDIPLNTKNRAVNIEDDSLNIEDIPLNTKN